MLSKLSQSHRNQCIDEARQLAATSARTGDWVADFVTELAAFGYAVVPREATNKMICAALDAHDKGDRSYSETWSAMVCSVSDQ